ncbi:unnamed protein product [Durusdinium trenchii]|uniref:Uncharacterized protein n=1 Tax=Durusdinium trenchii TaxID=1381693 RepID=A0ABP0JXV8_9DINO
MVSYAELLLLGLPVAGRPEAPKEAPPAPTEDPRADARQTGDAKPKLALLDEATEAALTAAAAALGEALEEGAGASQPERQELPVPGAFLIQRAFSSEEAQRLARAVTLAHGGRAPRVRCGSADAGVLPGPTVRAPGFGDVPAVSSESSLVRFDEVEVDHTDSYGKASHPRKSSFSSHTLSKRVHIERDTVLARFGLQSQSSGSARASDCRGASPGVAAPSRGAGAAGHPREASTPTPASPRWAEVFGGAGGPRAGGVLLPPVLPIFAGGSQSTSLGSLLLPLRREAQRALQLFSLFLVALHQRHL